VAQAVAEILVMIPVSIAPAERESREGYAGWAISPGLEGKHWTHPMPFDTLMHKRASVRVTSLPV